VSSRVLAIAAVCAVVVIGAAFFLLPRRAAAPTVLEARQTPTGWVVEANAIRRPS